MQLSDYTFYLIVAESNSWVPPTLALEAELTTANRIVYAREGDGQRFLMVVGLLNATPVNLAAEFAYIGSVFGLHKSVVQAVADFMPDVTADLRAKSCFMTNRPF
jgi:hypothetical protein